MATMFDNLLSPIVRGLSQSGLLQGSNRQVAEESFSLPAPSSGGGFAANYTPIRFAPLVSLTGPVMAPATPAAPEAAAPMLRPPMPMMADQGGGYETPQRTDAAFQNLQPIGTRIEQNGIGPELRDLGRGLSFMTSPLMSTGSLLATGKLPLEYVLGEMGGAAQPGAPVQGTPAAPFGGFLQGLQNFLFGSQQESVPLGSSRADLSSQGQGMGFAAFNDAMNAAMSGGASAEMADAAGRAAIGLVSQGMDPASAVALASMTALGQVGPEMPAGMGGAPVAPQAAQTFALGQPGNIESSTQMGGMGGADSPFGGFTGGDWGPGDTPGGYDTNTGAYSDITGFE
jgi:hypothetical protein